jgi:hypothetical protein
VAFNNDLNYAIILCGDFNSTPDGFTYKLLTSHDIPSFANDQSSIEQKLQISFLLDWRSSAGSPIVELWDKSGLYKGDCDGLRRMISCDDEKARVLLPYLDNALGSTSTTTRLGEITQIFRDRQASPIFEVSKAE